MGLSMASFSLLLNATLIIIYPPPCGFLCLKSTPSVSDTYLISPVVPLIPTPTTMHVNSGLPKMVPL